MGIEARQCLIFHAKIKGRRYFNKSAAIHAETMAIIRKKYPDEIYEVDNGYYFRCEEMEGFKKIYRRLKRLVSASLTPNPAPIREN